MTWTTIALIAIAAVVLIVLIGAAAMIIAVRMGRNWFRDESRRMDEEHEEWRRRHGFPERRRM